MHDWTLKTIFLDWGKSTVDIHLVNQQGAAQIIAEKIEFFSMTRKEEWGPSVSINQVNGPSLQKEGDFFMQIEMQSGDKITIRAKHIIVQSSPIDLKNF